eukprot:TRINITY_DN103849_c0_g1_i1.p1 TRINITY_DN103849_c0_g1~~TRINITY_DN103849_c0_g1_i1.p1  ORF type:complete len:542 (+),score=176.53 TRINITY_DN103849_c0_g1_i1:56-1681(+)
MAEARAKDIKAGDVSKAALEQSSMDLTGFRMGKQRLVSKKKRLSQLKKTILEDREYRRGDDASRLQQPGLGAASRGMPAGPQQLSADAPAFMPSFMPAELLQSAGESSEAASSVPRAKVTASAPKPPGPLKPGIVESGGAKEPELAAVEEEEPEELPLTEAIERLRNLQQEAKKPRVAAPAKGENTTADGGDRPADDAKTKQPPPPRADLEVRHYVHQELSDELDERVKFILSELVRFQDRAKEQNAMKYAKLKRYCVGLREARRAIARNKCKGLIVAPNLEVSNLEGGLDDTVEDVIEEARDNEIPVIFALSRNRIGKAMGKNIRLSVVALHSVEGVHQQFREVVKLAEELRRRWVMRQMAHATSEYAEQAQRRAEEKAARDTARREEKERLAAAQAAEEERRREANRVAKAAKAEARAKKVAEQKEAADRRRAEKDAEAKAREDEKRVEDAKLEAERKEEEKIAEEKRRKEAEVADRERKEAERQRREVERKTMQEQQKRLAEAAAARAAQGVPEAKAEESDAESSGSDLPLGFNANLF